MSKIFSFEKREGMNELSGMNPHRSTQQPEVDPRMYIYTIPISHVSNGRIKSV